MQEFICKYQEIVTYWLRGRDCLSGEVYAFRCSKSIQVLLFRLYEKVIKRGRFLRSFCFCKKNQKADGANALRPRFKIPSVGVIC